MNRRDFLRTGISTAAPFILGSPALLFASNRGEKAGSFTILHTNDTHARIDPFPDSHPKLGGLGGIARRAKAVKEIRLAQPETLLLDCGDVFQGTPYFNFFKGSLDLELMTEMGYAASTLGNHEFDNGIDGFCESAKKAGFPFLNCNYAFGNSRMKEFTQPYLIKQVSGLKVGLFGLGIAFESLVLPSMHGEIAYTDPVEAAKKMVEFLRKTEKCDFVICVSHLGFEYPDARVSDKVIAASVPGIDIVLGGHTHTFLDQPFIFDRDGQKTVVSQVGWGGAILGRLDVTFNGDGKIKTIAQANAPINAQFG